MEKSDTGPSCTPTHSACLGAAAGNEMVTVIRVALRDGSEAAIVTVARNGAVNVSGQNLEKIAVGAALVRRSEVAALEKILFDAEPYNGFSKECWEDWED